VTNDRRHLAELNHREHPQPTLVTEEALAAWARVATPLVRFADRAVDQPKISDRGVLLEDLRVDKRWQYDLDALRRSRP